MTAPSMPLVRHIRRLLRYRDQPGTLHVLPTVHSEELGNDRDVYVYLPPDYDHDVRRYPVVYMQDGQNLFDTGTSFAGSWHVENAVMTAARLDLPAIVVGVPNAGAERILEYSPFADARHGIGWGDRYLDFLAGTLKPMIDERYRTLRGRLDTGIAGSSMGGLISLYAGFKRRDIFGFSGVLSPSLWFANASIFPVIEEALAGDQDRPRIYLDVGGYEGQSTVTNARRMRNLLISNGYQYGVDLRWVEDPGGTHHEAAWARRFRKALPALLAGPTTA
jgi:predicted alpha/beta superfamily hydrolase